MDERRIAYRVPTDGSMIAEIRAEDARWRGRVVDTSDGGVRVVFPPSDAPTLRVGTGNLEVWLEGGPLAAPVLLAATVRMRADAEVVEYGLGFRDPRQVERLLPSDARAAFNRRREPRIAAPETETWVSVQASEGPSRGRKIVGQLLDVSAGGLGLLIPAVNEDVFTHSPTVICTWIGPGRMGERVKAGRIVNRTLVDPLVRYGIAFFAPAERKPQREVYEAAWDCVVCGTRLLLAQSHVHCPGCGTPRADQPTYFPDWDDAELNTEHWAWGVERTCPFCAVSSSDLVTFCGRCGRPLP